MSVDSVSRVSSVSSGSSVSSVSSVHVYTRVYVYMYVYGPLFWCFFDELIFDDAIFLFFFFSAQSQDKRRFKRNCRLSCDWAIVFNLYYLFERSMTGQAASITTDCHLFLFIYFLKKIYFYLSFFFKALNNRTSGQHHNRLSILDGFRQGCLLSIVCIY
jgi:hypothetical protein